MDRRTKIVIFIISTIFSFVMIFLTYFGCTRYTTIYSRSLEKYINDYVQSDKIYDNGVKRVVITLSTTPKRIKKLSPVIKSLLDQTMRVDQIALNISSNKDFTIPESYKKVLNIFRIGKDTCNSAMCIVPTIKREGEYGTIIIALDDNKVYGKDYIESMVIEGKKYPGYAIKSHGGILLCPEFFDESIIDTNEIFDSDWLKKHLRVKIKHLDYSENYKAI